MLTQERLKHLLWYTPSTGEFFWKNPPTKGPVNVGNRAGGENGRGYLIIGIGGKGYRAHRLAWLYVHGYFPENDLDHINRDRSDNRLANLREVSRSCNVRNSENRADNTSSVKGICWSKRKVKWETSMCVGGLNKFLGYFDDFTEAVAHRLAGEQCLNFQNCNSSSPAYQYMQSVVKVSFKPPVL